MNDIVYIFDGTFFGFLTVVFKCFENKNFSCGIQDSLYVQESFCCEYIKIDTDYIKAERVYNGIINKISVEASENVYMAFLSFRNGRFTDILKYIELGFKVGATVDDYKKYDFVLNVIKNRRSVGQEAHLLTGFVRFRETKENILYSEISPNNDVLEILAEHFSDRLKDEKWLINDVKRRKCAVYNGNEFIIAEGEFQINIVDSEKEEAYQKLWCDFFNTIGIENRKNVKLQNGMLPKRFRRHMIEFLRER